MTWYEDLMTRKRSEGKTKIIPNRENTKTYLERLHLHERKYDFKLLWKKISIYLPFRANLHCIHISDDPSDGLHDHPWPFVTFVLKGGYWEHLKNGKRKWRGPGSIIIARARRLHRLELSTKRVIKVYPECVGHGDCQYYGTEEVPCWTLFIMGPRRKGRDWGFLVDGKWYPHQTWLDMREKKAVHSEFAEAYPGAIVYINHSVQNQMPFGKNEDGIFDQPWPGEPGFYHTSDPEFGHNPCREIVIGPTYDIKNRALNKYNQYMKGKTNAK